MSLSLSQVCIFYVTVIGTAVSHLAQRCYSDKSPATGGVLGVTKPQQRNQKDKA